MNTIGRGGQEEPRLALLCNPYHRGGIERFMADLAMAWPGMGGACWLVVPRPRAPFRNAGTSHTVSSVVGAAHQVPRGLWMVEPPVGPEFEFGTEAYRAAVYARALLDVVPEGVPVITSDDPAAWRAASWLASRNPAILVIHGDYDGYYSRLERYAPIASAIVPISRRIEERIRERSLGAAARVEHIPLGIALGEARAESPSARDDVLRLLWVGRMDESSKRISDLPRIATRLRERGAGFLMTFVGDGADRPALESAVNAANLRDRIRFHGWASSRDVHAMLRESDVLLLPSNREGLPVAMMEALAAGCAVVASRVSGVEDYESHLFAKGSLWVHDVGDANRAAELVAQALAVPRAERIRRARALAEAEFSIERCAERYTELIAHLPATRTPGRALGSFRKRLIELVSAPIAAERRLRLWAADR